MSSPKIVSGPSRTSEDAAQIAALGDAVMMLHRRVSDFKALANRSCGDTDRAAYSLLFRLLQDGPQRPSALAEQLHSDISTISRQTALLVQEGYAERIADQKDGRASLLAVTATGRELCSRLRTSRNDFLADVLGSWSPEEIEDLTVGLNRLNADVAGSLAKHEHRSSDN